MTGQQRRRMLAFVRRVEERANTWFGAPTYVRGAGTYRMVRRAVDAGLVVAMVSKGSILSLVPRELAVYPVAHVDRARREYMAMMPKRRRA